MIYVGHDDKVNATNFGSDIKFSCFNMQKIFQQFNRNSHVIFVLCLVLLQTKNDLP